MGYAAELPEVQAYVTWVGWLWCHENCGDYEASEAQRDVEWSVGEAIIKINLMQFHHMVAGYDSQTLQINVPHTSKLILSP